MEIICKFVMGVLPLDISLIDLYILNHGFIKIGGRFLNSTPPL